MDEANFGWGRILRLGLVQTALGAIVVLTTSTLNRVMAVELALPAMVPGALVTLHHAMQMLRPKMGHGSDAGTRLTRWIIGGMFVLALGGFGAACATAYMAESQAVGIALAAVSFVAIGVGVSAAGTSLPVLLAKRTAPERRAASATVVWIMMIFGFAVTAGTAGQLLDPYTPARLVAVSGAVCAGAFVVAVLALWGIEGTVAATPKPKDAVAFREALAQVWAEPDARRFTLFVFISMIAYSAQDLILEPFAGVQFGFSPGESTSLAGTQHGGAFAGMVLVALVTSFAKGTRLASLRGWVIGGCLASAAALAGLSVAGVLGLESWPLKPNVFFLGLANGAFSIAAIGSMMAMAGRGRASREGTRMGLWGAAQSIASAAGGFVGTVIADAASWTLGSTPVAYGLVFGFEAIAFVVAMRIATTIRFEENETTAQRDVLGLSTAGSPA